MSNPKRFAAFIMTYERPQILLDTINKLLAQTLPPQKILVVDNSKNTTTKDLIENLCYERVAYISTGYNAGPAGASKIGLDVLAQEGYEWIYWGDDDDPPQRGDIFETLITLAESGADVGAIGSVGGHFNRYFAKTSGLKNKDINGLTEVDYIPGGFNFIINGDVIRDKISPTKELFFGFEELDFCIKLKKAGYKIYVDGDTLLKGRMRSERSDKNFKWRGKSFGKESQLNRNYYSLRNMMCILYKNKYYIGLSWLFGKSLLKSLVGFRFGFKYGLSNIIVVLNAIMDFLRGRLGQRKLL